MISNAVDEESCTWSTVSAAGEVASYKKHFKSSFLATATETQQSLNTAHRHLGVP